MGTPTPLPHSPPKNPAADGEVEDEPLYMFFSSGGRTDGRIRYTYIFRVADKPSEEACEPPPPCPTPTHDIVDVCFFPLHSPHNTLNECIQIKISSVP